MNKSKVLTRLTATVLTVVTMMVMMFTGSFVFADAVEDVETLLSAMPTMQTMYEARGDFHVSGVYNTDDPASVAEHEAAQKKYAYYLNNANNKRKLAQEAYDALTPEQQAEVDPALLKKLTDTLEDTFNYDTSYNISPRTDEYNYQMVQISSSKYLAYELSMHLSPDEDMPCTLVITDVSTPNVFKFKPDGPYEYGTNNYEVTYCCDERVPTVYLSHYKRINLENCDYYNSNQAGHIRAIMLKAYPYLDIDEFRQMLRDDGFEYADEIDKSDAIAAIQFAIWHFSNRMTNPNLERDTSYGYTGNSIDYRIKGTRLIDSVNDYRNELWYWWDTENTWDHKTYSYYRDIDKRVTALRNYLINLDPVGPSDSETVISKAEILRTGVVKKSDGTYDLSLKIMLNTGAGAEDDVEIRISVIEEQEDGTYSIPSDSDLIHVTSEKEYTTTLTVKPGQIVTVEVTGTQVLPKSVYYYDPIENEHGDGKTSQSLVSVAEGETRIGVYKEFTFEEDIDTGLRIYKTETETGKPMEGINFNIYKVEPDEGETLNDEPTEEDLERFAVEANLVDKVTTDSTGYAAIELDKGTYLLVEEDDPSKTKDPVKPMFFTLPVAKEVDDGNGNIQVEYDEILDLELVNRPPDEPGSVSFRPEVTKEINDWGDAESFTFVLEAVTEGAPMPKTTTAVATKDDPLAVFDYITYYDPGKYEYTITEVDDGVPFVTYDTTPHTIKVEIIEVDGSPGKLVMDLVYDGDQESLTITNSYNVVPVKVAPKVTKEIEEWGDAESFTFKLAAVTKDAPMPSSDTALATKENPEAVFGNISFSATGTYEYTITEVDDGVPFITYDTEPHKVFITVSKGTSGFVAEISYDGKESLTVTNTYKLPPAEVVPKVTKEIKDWGKSETFTFILEAVTKDAPMPSSDTAVATKDKPTAEFGTISFEEPGTYEYTITEVDDGVEDVTYDTEPHKVVVTVTKGKDGLTAEIAYDGEADLTVVNTRVPKTDDAGSIGAYLFTMMLCAVSVFLIRRYARKLTD